MPDRLVDLRVDLESDVAADATDAEVALARFDAGAQALTSSEALARLLLRAESVASSYIEGLTASPGRVLRADAARAAGIAVGDRTAHEILANIDALAYAVEASGDITVDRLLEVHRRLLGSTPLREHAGIVRDRQNWIGGSAYTPIGARFVPPPPEYVVDLLADLCTFCNDDALPAVVQAALAHAQFEAIHPFADGNGRTGRALTYMVLRRRGLAMRATPPISLVLATQSQAYVALLNATCVAGSPTSAAARAGRNRWIAFFAAACSRAVAQAEAFEARVAEIVVDWRSRLSGVRGDATALALLDRLPAAPVLNVATAASLSGRSIAAANNAVRRLVDVGILVPSKAHRRNRTFEASAILEAFVALERRLASPAGDTYLAKPARAVPLRPKR